MAKEIVFHNYLYCFELKQLADEFKIDYDTCSNTPQKCTFFGAYKHETKNKTKQPQQKKYMNNYKLDLTVLVALTCAFRRLEL